MIEKVAPIIRSMGCQLIPYDSKYRLQKNNLFIDVSLNALDSINVNELVIILPHSLQIDKARLSFLFGVYYNKHICSRHYPLVIL